MTYQSKSAAVTVLLPVYNGERYLAEAIESVLGQTFGAWVLLVLDDGSTDSSARIASNYANRDPRIRMIGHRENRGLIANLNHGLNQVVTKYIARLDSDDAMLPNRLERQIAFLEAHLEIGIVGGAAILTDSRGQAIGHKSRPYLDEEIRWHEMTSHSASFFHPAVMMRRSVLVEASLQYDPQALYCEDKKLWLDLLAHTRGCNLAEPLIRYRRHDASVTATKSKQQRAYTLPICCGWMQGILGEPVDPALAGRMLDWSRPVRPEDVQTWRLSARLLDAMQRQPGVDPDVIRRIRVQIALRLLRYAPITLWPQLLQQGIFRSLLKSCGPRAFAQAAIKQRALMPI